MVCGFFYGMINIARIQCYIISFYKSRKILENPDQSSNVTIYEKNKRSYNFEGRDYKLALLPNYLLLRLLLSYYYWDYKLTSLLKDVSYSQEDSQNRFCIKKANSSCSKCKKVICRENWLTSKLFYNDLKEIND